MNPTWDRDQSDFVSPRPGVLGCLVALCRFVPVFLTLTIGLLVLLALRPIERRLHGHHRPWTGRLVVRVCRICLAVIGLRVERVGDPPAEAGAVVANHSSWLDILVLNARKPVYFVSKAEVADWPGFGALARATGTVFIQRRQADARAHRDLLEQRLAIGHRLLFFPEGTSTDGLRVVAFKSSLFEALIREGQLGKVFPVSVRYIAPPGRDPRFYGWWGDMTLPGHLLRVLGQVPQGSVRVSYMPPIEIEAHAGRKALAQASNAAVVAGFGVENQ